MTHSLRERALAALAERDTHRAQAEAAKAAREAAELAERRQRDIEHYTPKVHEVLGDGASVIPDTWPIRVEGLPGGFRDRAIHGDPYGTLVWDVPCPGACKRDQSYGVTTLADVGVILKAYETPDAMARDCWYCQEERDSQRRARQEAERRARERAEAAAAAMAGQPTLADQLAALLSDLHDRWHAAEGGDA